MTTNLATLASNNGQIIKSGLSDGRRAKFLPSVVGVVYDWLRYECHLGNVGENRYRDFQARHNAGRGIGSTFRRFYKMNLYSESLV